MPLLTEDTIHNARERLLDMWDKPRARRISDTEVAITCENAAHPEGHICRFERRANGDLWGECVQRHTGELCPAELGKRVRVHLAGAVTVFLALEARDRDGQAELAAKFDRPMPPPAGHMDDAPLIPTQKPKGERRGAFQI
jgi:hypothetical protein